MSSPDGGTGHDVVVASSWLPVTFDHGRVRWRTRPGSTSGALGALVAERHGAWIGWSDSAEPVESAVGDLWLYPIAMSQREIEDYYHGHCASSLVPLYHDCGVSPQFRRPWCEAYREINQRFAMTAARVAAPGAMVWIHDYHLQLMPGYLRRLRDDVRIGLFLHGPFPPAERFLQQPMRAEVLQGVLGADLVGFQQGRSARNFLDLAAELAGLRCGDDVVQVGERRVAISTFPTSVDAAAIHRLATDAHVRGRAAAVRDSLGNPRLVLLSIGPSSTAEGIDRRLDAYAQLLAEHRLDPEDVVLVHIGVSGDEHGPHHEDCRHRVDRQVAQINGVRSRVGRPAIHYLRHELDLAELTAFYLAADIMLATPLRQGMTLAAKEYVAARTDDTGRLVLSEFSGAATDLSEAILVNPHDIDQLKNAILFAAAECHAPTDAMRAMRLGVGRRDAHRWAADYLAALAGTTPDSGPSVGPLYPSALRLPTMAEETYARTAVREVR
jgi:trehalose 6-phosphate synthase